MEHIALVGHALGATVPEVVMGIADGELRLHGRFRGEGEPVKASEWHDGTSVAVWRLYHGTPPASYETGNSHVKWTVSPMGTMTRAHRDTHRPRCASVNDPPPSTSTNSATTCNSPS